LSVEGNSISFPEVSFQAFSIMSFRNRVLKQFKWASTVFFFLKVRPFGGTDGSVSHRMDLGSKSFVLSRITLGC
jgi:hypothetical protein